MRTLLALAAVVILVGMSGSAAAAEVVAPFDPALGEFPEGIAIAADGTMYVSLAPLGEIRRLDDAGSWSTFFRFDPGTTGLGVLGLAADREGTIYAAVPSDSSGAHGVWAITPGGDAVRLPGSEQIVFPNALALDPHHNLYISDSILGAIWRIPSGGRAELWLQHELLAGLAELNPFPLGANGVAYLRGRLLVANTEKKQVVEIPIDAMGAPGAPQIFDSFGPTDYLDGIAVDVVGNAYVLVAGRSELVRISPSGEAATVATADDGLNVPASLAFGTRSTARRTLYVTNFALPIFTPVPTPGVLALDVPHPGPPLP